MIHPRHQALLEELPKNGNKVMPSAIKAGYKPSYAKARGKKILETAIKAKANDIIERIEATPISSLEAKQMMSELVGISREDLMSNIRYLATQEKDLSTRLKVVAPLAKEYGVNLGQDDQNKTIVPILNIGISENGSIEPPKESISEYIPIDSDANSPSS